MRIIKFLVILLVFYACGCGNKYENHIEGYNLSLPMDWEKVNSNQDIMDGHIQATGVEFRKKKPLINLARFKGARLILIKWEPFGFVDDFSIEDFLIKDWLINSSNILNRGELTIHNKSAQWYIYKTNEVISVETQETEFGEQSIEKTIETKAKIFFIKNNKNEIYTLYFSTLDEDFNQFEDAFNKIAFSFKVN